MFWSRLTPPDDGPRIDNPQSDSGEDYDHSVEHSIVNRSLPYAEDQAANNPADCNHSTQQRQRHQTTMPGPPSTNLIAGPGRQDRSDHPAHNEGGISMKGRWMAESLDDDRGESCNQASCVAPSK